MKRVMLVFVLLGAVVLLHGFRGPAAGDAARGGRPAPAESRFSDRRSGLRVAEVVRMGPEEWRARFRNEDIARDPRLVEDIAELAGGLQELLDKGADPRGEDARVYAEAILALLESREGDG